MLPEERSSGKMFLPNIFLPALVVAEGHVKIRVTVHGHSSGSPPGLPRWKPRLATTPDCCHEPRPGNSAPIDPARRRGRTAASFGLGKVPVEFTSTARPTRILWFAGSCQTGLPPAQGRRGGIGPVEIKNNRERLSLNVTAHGRSSGTPLGLPRWKPRLATTPDRFRETRPSSSVSMEPARRRGRIEPRAVPVSAKCRLNSPLPLDRLDFRALQVVVKPAFHRHKADGEPELPSRLGVRTTVDGDSPFFPDAE